MNLENEALLRLLQQSGNGRGSCCGEAEPRGNANTENGCGQGWSAPSLAMVYAPMQRFEELYEPDESLCHGTLFRQLDKPFWGGRCR